MEAGVTSVLQLDIASTYPLNYAIASPTTTTKNATLLVKCLMGFEALRNYWSADFLHSAHEEVCGYKKQDSSFQN